MKRHRRQKKEGRAGVLTLAAAGVLVGAALVLWTAGEPADQDADGMSDAYETFLGLDPADPADAPLNYDTDRLVNLQESTLWTDPFSGDTDADGWADDVDANPLSRAVIFWGLDELTEGDHYHYPGPPWWLGAWREGGDWTAQGWHVPASDAPGSGSLYIEVQPGPLNAELVHEIELIDHPGASLYLDLVDASNEEVATDLFGNLLQGTETRALRTLTIPLAYYPGAAAIRLRRGTGEITVNTSVLYVDADGDGLDADQEAQLGTSDHNPDTDGDGIGDAHEAKAGIDPTHEADLPSGASTAPLPEKSAAASPASAETATGGGLSALALISNQLGAVYSSPLSGGAQGRSCYEYGPFYSSWDCAVEGASNTAGALSATNLEVLVGETIVPPTLDTAPTFLDGAMRYWVSYTCPENVEHWETNTVRYLAGELYFDPPIPGSITNACTNVYAAKVNGEPASIAGWWPGEDSTEDLIWTNNAVLYGNVAYASAQVGKGFELSNTGDYVEIPASTELDVGKTPGLSFECWIKPTSSGAWQPIFEWKKGTNNLYGAHLWIVYSGNLAVNLYDIHDGWHYFRTYTPPIHTNGFQHIAVTYDHATGTAKLYHDAVVVASASFGSFVAETSSDLMLGRREGVQNRFDGIIDEPSVYHCALSSNDVAAIYNAGSAGKKWDGSPTNGVAIPAGCTCSSVTNELGEVQIIAYADTDGDLMPDWWEIEHGLNPTSGVSDDLAAWWKFDEGSGTNVENSVSDDFDGFTVSMDSNNWVAGRLGGALSFDGTTDHVKIPQTSGAVITGNEYTVSAWVWMDSSSTAQYMPVIADMNNGLTGYWLGYDTDGANQLELFWGDAVGSTDRLGETDHSLFTNQWVHIAATHDGSTSFFYLNGTEVDSATSPSFDPAQHDPLYIGWDRWDYPWKGMIDDVRIYTSALASNEVASIYDALQDPDGDGRTNLEEYQLGSNPFSDDRDNDGDGLPNGIDAYPEVYDTSAAVFTITSPSEGAEY